MIELTTQCPQCQHQFDVSLEQLQQRKGLLRCTRCAQIFDAYECAVPKPTAATEPTPAPDSTLSFTPPPSQLDGFTISASAPKLDAAEPFIGRRADAAVTAGSSLIKTRAQTAAAMRSQQPIQSAVETESEEDIRVYLNRESGSEPTLKVQTDDFRGFSAEPRRTTLASESDTPPAAGWSRSVWIVIVWLLLALTVLQVIYVYRAQIANTVGFTRPVLQLLCDGVGCTVPYMREVNAIEVRQSSLQQQPNFEQNGQYAYSLQLQLKNTLPWAQEWPTLVVSFSDAAAAVLATIAIPPQEYLAPSQRNRPFDPAAQLNIRLPVLLPDKKINGFIVEKYYP